MADVVRRRLRVVVGLTALAELVVFVLVAAWIGLGWTIVATLVTSALGWVLLARQGRRALADLRERARSHERAGRELGDAGLVAVGGLLMVLPGFLGDLLGLLCLLPGTRGLVRRALMRVVLARLPDHMRGPVRVGSTRAAPVDPDGADRPLVIEGEVLRDPDSRS
ncbi:FxsA family protein [Blastococcus sp. SYSU DS0619]